MRRSRRRLGPYVRAKYRESEQHPVDVAIARMLPQKRLSRRIANTTDRLVRALGEHARVWLELEELLAEYSANREEAYFRFGYEHGLAEGRAHALRVTGRGARAPKTATDHPQHQLANRLRELTIQAGLPLPLTVAPLLETAWAITVGLSQQSVTTDPRRQR